jgi:hypothetical protein
MSLPPPARGSAGRKAAGRAPPRPQYWLGRVRSLETRVEQAEKANRGRDVRA